MHQHLMKLVLFFPDFLKQTDYFYKVLYIGLSMLVSGEKGRCSVILTYVATHKVHRYQCYGFLFKTSQRSSKDPVKKRI